LDAGETGWDCHSGSHLEWVQKQPGFNKKNVSLEYRFALYGVDCADYCPEVCQFQFMTGPTCDSKYVSYELHANPMGFIRNTSQWKYHYQHVWDKTIPTWTYIHINNKDCTIKLNNGAKWSDNFIGAGCKKIGDEWQQPIEVSSTEVCKQKETFYTMTKSDQTLDNHYETREHSKN